jgi:acyl-CoA thioesterase FadM
VPILWAALDCPGGWSVDIVGRPMVLGTMTARVLARPGYEERCVVTGRAVEVGERKARTATSLYGQSGELLATAAHVWVAVDPSTFGAAGAGT